LQLANLKKLSINMQFLLTAFDGKDKDALARRMAVRETHFENIRKLKESGNFISGGAILDDSGIMISQPEKILTGCWRKSPI